MLSTKTVAQELPNHPIALSPKPIRILSIDGGGLRGLLAIKILKWVESQTKKTIFDSFDVFAGTSTGGLIVSALTMKDKSNPMRPKYSLDDIEGIYLNHGKDIFPKCKNILQKGYHGARNIIRSRFSEKGLHKVLQQYFGNSRLNDCLKPILVTAYDVDRYKPIYFSSRYINPSSKGFSRNRSANPELINICRATSAAPIFLPSHPFVYIDKSDEDYSMNCIDGGVFVNNPSLAAYVEVMENLNDPLYSQGITHRVEDIFILSIGTGTTRKSVNNPKAIKWGMYKWTKPVIEVMMQGNSQAIHNQLESLLGYRYYRLDVSIDHEFSNFTDCSEEAFNHWSTKVQQELVDNNHEENIFKNFSRFAQL